MVLRIKDAMVKHLKYLSYVMRHKWFVFVECCKLGIPFVGIVHDISKLRPSEWFPYTETFYGVKIKNCYDCIRVLGNQCGVNGSGIDLGRCAPECKDFATSAYSLAWLKHQHRNPHHWQHWILTQDEDEPIILEMPIRHRKEMLADWRGAGRAQGFGDNTKAWYEDHKHDMVLGLFTRQWIEKNI